MNHTFTKAQLAKELGISRAYMTMIANGNRKPSKEIVNKVRAIYGDKFVNEGCNPLLTFNQGVTGSRPVRPTKASKPLLPSTL